MKGNQAFWSHGHLIRMGHLLLTNRGQWRSAGGVSLACWRSTNTLNWSELAGALEVDGPWPSHWTCVIYYDAGVFRAAFSNDLGHDLLIKQQGRERRWVLVDWSSLFPVLCNSSQHVVCCRHDSPAHIAAAFPLTVVCFQCQTPWMASWLKVWNPSM